LASLQSEFWARASVTNGQRHQPNPGNCFTSKALIAAFVELDLLWLRLHARVHLPRRSHILWHHSVLWASRQGFLWKDRVKGGVGPVQGHSLCRMEGAVRGHSLPCLGLVRRWRMQMPAGNRRGIISWYGRDIHRQSLCFTGLRSVKAGQLCTGQEPVAPCRNPCQGEDGPGGLWHNLLLKVVSADVPSPLLQLPGSIRDLCFDAAAGAAVDWSPQAR